MRDRIRNGRTDLVFDWTAAGNAAAAEDERGVPLIRWCAYYGDVSAIRHLLAQGAPLASLGDNLDLNGAAFHGHWQLCQFLLEQGADPNRPLGRTGETPLHAALTKANCPAADHVVRVLLDAGADSDAETVPGVETGSFMRDARARGETPLHRAAAYGSEASIRMLLAAGARQEARDAHGDSPLGWASWHLRPPEILRLLCFGDHVIREGAAPLETNLLGKPGGDNA
jgi:ankyrin repeat protein